MINVFVGPVRSLRNAVSLRYRKERGNKNNETLTIHNVYPLRDGTFSGLYIYPVVYLYLDML